MEEKFLLVESTDRVSTITLNRPEKRNALSPPLLVELLNALKKMKEEDVVRCVVIRGMGEKAFCAGYDISHLPANVSLEISEAVKEDSPLDNGMKAVVDFPYPIIAMINGLAYGAGCELAVTCDIRIAADDARFSMPPAKLGIVYRWRGMLKFLEIVGLANAKEMFFTGRSYGASQAKEMGLVHHVVPREQLSEYVYGIAREISENAPLSLKGTKSVFNRLHSYKQISSEDIQEMEAMRYEAYWSEDIKEGRQAFREKRKPGFKGS